MNTTSGNDQSDPVYSRKVLDMLTVANEYCLFLEKAEEYPKESVLSFLLKICPLIYLKASLLPEITEVNDDAAEHFVTEEEWEGIFNSLQVKFGENDPFVFIDHHEKSHTDPVKASLAEAFADIYQDLKDFLLLYQKPLKSSMEYAVYDCKRLFETHYGYLLVNAQQALHFLIYKESVNGGPNEFWED
jgi:hypothetical protein